MHASLASIGRACTVEDEEPPDTPTHSSLDSQSDATQDVAAAFNLPTGNLRLSIRDLVETGANQTRELRIVPYWEKAVLREDTDCGSERPEPVQDPTSSTDTITTPGQSSPPTVSYYNHLNRLTRLHRLCDLIRRAVLLDSLAGSHQELSAGLLGLAPHADRITTREYELCESCLASFHPTPQSPLSLNRSRPHHNESAMDSAFPQSHYRVPSTLNTSQLSELRVLCESVRQSLTQWQRFYNEQRTVGHLAGQLAGGSGSHPTASCEQSISGQWATGAEVQRLTTASLIAAHHLIHIGLALLAHTDLTRFTHGELWEMMRGMEELDILSRQVQTTRRLSRANRLRHYLTRLCSSTRDPRLLQPSPVVEVMQADLLSDPLHVISPLSVGYMFVLIAHQRSIRLSHAVYRQLLAILSAIPGSPSHRDDSSMDAVPENPSSTAQPSLVEAFRSYLTRNYDRSASDYLRAEYEFIADFLDVLSRSTGFLYQVQKLKLICTVAAAATQARKTKDAQLLAQRLEQTNDMTVLGYPGDGSSGRFHAMSVEGKHGILIHHGQATKPMGHRDTLGDSESNTRSSKGRNSSSGLTAQYQDTLHRACTFDRYVATGSVLCPYTCSESTESENKLPSGGTGMTQSPSPTVSTAQASTLTEAKKAASKKVVQWSDHREISTRHQVIGRFLEMIWHCTETLLHQRFLCPPTEAVITIQSDDMGSSVSSPASFTPSFSGTQSPHGEPLGPNMPEGQSKTRLVGCLRMSSSKLRQLAKHLREVARSALSRQSSAHSNPSVPIQLTYDSKALPVLDTDSLDKSVSCALQTVTHRLKSNQTSPRDSLPITWPKSVQSDLCCLLQLLLDCVNRFSPTGSGGGCAKAPTELTARVDARLRALGVTFRPDHDSLRNSVGTGHNRLRIQSTYDLARRIDPVVARLRTALPSSLRNDCELLESAFQSFENSSADQIDTAAAAAAAAHLLQTTQWMIDHIARTVHIFSWLQLIHHVMDALQQNLCHSFGTGRPMGVNDTHLELDLTALLNSTRHSLKKSSGQSGQLELTEVLRLARVLHSLKSMRHLVENEWSIRLWSIHRRIRTRYHHICRVLLDQLWPWVIPSSSPEASFATQAIDSVVHVLQDAALPPNCPACFSTTPTSFATEGMMTASSVCSFHTLVYEQALCPLFDALCWRWLEIVNRSQLDQCDTDLLRHHTTSAVQYLRNVLLAQPHIPVALVSILCESELFQRLQSTTLSPYEELCWSGTRQSVCAMGTPSSETRSRYMEHNQSSRPAGSPTSSCSVEDSTFAPIPCTGTGPVSTRQTVRNRLSNRLHTPTEALAAFAAGVRTSFMVPFKNRTSHDLPVWSTVSSATPTDSPTDPCVSNPMAAATTSGFSHDSSSSSSPE